MKRALILTLALPVVTGAATGPQTVTGSHIPRETRRIGRSCDTVAPVYIVDRTDIQRSGATTVSAVLRRVPFVYGVGGR
jgi:outer membrane cobalamin receptor